MIVVSIDVPEQKNTYIVALRSVEQFSSTTTVKYRFGKSDVECRWEKYMRNGYQIQFLHSTQRDALAAVHFHVFSLFGGCTNIQLQITLGSTQKSTFLSKINGVKDIAIEGERVDAGRLEEVLNMYPNQNSVVILPVIAGSLNSTSRIMTVENVYIENAGSFAPIALQNFTGCNLRFFNSLITDTDIVSFIKKWLVGESFQKLETAIIWVVGGHQLDSQNILNEFEVTQFDRTRNPQVYDYNPRIMDYIVNPNHGFNGIGFWDLQREIDNKVASLKITSTKFMFCVWN